MKSGTVPSFSPIQETRRSPISRNWVNTMAFCPLPVSSSRRSRSISAFPECSGPVIFGSFEKSSGASQICLSLSMSLRTLALLSSCESVSVTPSSPSLTKVWYIAACSGVSSQ